MQRAKISFIILSILFHSFILLPDCPAGRDCTMYEPLYGIWEFTTARGYGTRTITLDEFDCNTLEYSVCLCGESDGMFAWAGGAYTVRVDNPNTSPWLIYTFTFLDADTVSGTFTAIIAGDVWPEDNFTGVKIQDFNTTTTTTSISPTTTTSYTPTTTIPSGNVTIRNHMMTKDPKEDTGCQTPIRTDTFYHYDEEAYCWFRYDNAKVGNELIFEWYKPNGELYANRTAEYHYASGCWYPGIYIDGYQPAYTSGNWRVDVYFDGDEKFTEYFIIEGLTSTSTTTSIITTTTMPPPVPTTTTSEKATFCPTSLIYGEQSEETEILRYFRDNILSQTPEGQELIKLYYQWSPIIIKAMEGDEEFKEEMKGIIDGILPLIRGEVE